MRTKTELINPMTEDKKKPTGDNLTNTCMEINYKSEKEDIIYVMANRLTTKQFFELDNLDIQLRTCPF